MDALKANGITVLSMMMNIAIVPTLPHGEWLADESKTWQPIKLNTKLKKDLHPWLFYFGVTGTVEKRLEVRAVYTLNAVTYGIGVFSLLTRVLLFLKFKMGHDSWYRLNQFALINNKKSQLYFFFKQGKFLVITFVQFSTLYIKSNIYILLIEL